MAKTKKLSEKEFTKGLAMLGMMFPGLPFDKKSLRLLKKYGWLKTIQTRNLNEGITNISPNGN